jgi:hypothetical protein
MQDADADRYGRASTLNRRAFLAGVAGVAAGRPKGDGALPAGPPAVTVEDHSAAESVPAPALQDQEPDPQNYRLH